MNCFASQIVNGTKMSDNGKRCEVKMAVKCDSNIDAETKMDESEVSKFYGGKKIFITGGTGFLGKKLLEKLLRTCSEIETIYLLVRVKKGKDGYRRLDDLLADSIFDRLRAEVPKFRHKIEVISGDCASPDLGITLLDRKTIVDNVNIIFHAAATVRFDESLRAALAINVKAAKQIITLAKEVNHLKALIHVSTAYSNCHLSRVEEKFYFCPFTCQSLEDFTNKYNDDEIEQLLPQVLDPWPNTYTFTKALAEKEIKETSKGLPLAIFRPAIVTSTDKEPIPGWIDNLYGPTGVVAGTATGVLRTLHCNDQNSAELVPVDRVVNCLIVSAYKISQDCEKRSEPKIFNYVSSVENRITWRNFTNYNLRILQMYPPSSAIWYASLTLNKSSFVNKLCMLFMHLLPAICLDSAAVLVGQKPRLLKAYRKLHKFSAVLAYFCTHEIVFCNRNVRELWKTTSQKDQMLFPFDMSNLDWEEYFSNYIKGIRLFLFKETDETIFIAQQRWKRLRVLHRITVAILYFVLLYILWKFICTIKTF